MFSSIHFLTTIPSPAQSWLFSSLGDVLVFTPPCHILVTDGCFYGDKGMFRVALPLEMNKLEAIFRHTVVRRLLNKGKITKELIALLSPGRPLSARHVLLWHSPLAH